MKLPAFQFYPGDWRKDTGVQSLDFQARGVWFEILCLMHESERRGVLTLNGNAMPDEALARLLGIECVLLKQILTTLLNHGVTSREPDTGALVNRRMVRDENLRQIRKNAGKQGGNPLLLKQNRTTHLKQKSTPSSSSSSSTSVDLALGLESPTAVAEVKKPRARNPLLDALVSLDGSNPAQVTSSAFSAAAKALKEIREVSPDVTPAEIARRAGNYAHAMKDATISPNALAKHWARCAFGPQPQATRSPGSSKANLPEPEGWRNWLNEFSPGSVYARGGSHEGELWTNLDAATQSWIASKIGAKGAR